MEKILIAVGIGIFMGSLTSSSIVCVATIGGYFLIDGLGEIGSQLASIAKSLEEANEK